MKYSFLSIPVTLSLFTSALQAQSEKPTNKAIEGQADAAKNIPAKNLTPQELVKKAANAKQLKLVQQRLFALQAQQTKYLQNLTNGKINPHQELLKHISEYQRQLELAVLHYKGHQATDNPVKKAQHAEMLFPLLQIIGPHLDCAAPKESDITLTPAQLDELKRLTEIADRPLIVSNQTLREASKNLAPATSPSLKFLSPDHLFTLIDLSTPIKVLAPPNSLVYFKANQGGRFKNGLSITELRADENGIVTAYWLSPGDSVADSEVSIFTPNIPEKLIANLEVQSLNFHPLVRAVISKNPKDELDDLPNKIPRMPTPAEIKKQFSKPANQ